MSKINGRPVRRTAAGVLASTLMLSGVVAAASPASAAAGFALDRIAGDNRYETSARIATAFGPTNSAILASGEMGHVVDALSANFLAGVQQAPVLLTTRNSIPASVRAVLNTLTGTRSVTIVGGTAAVSAAVEAELRTAGFTVTRLGGEDRYATSEAIITSARAQASNIGIVASGTNFPDALAGGPLAYKGRHPVFLTAGGSLPQDTIDAMVAAGTTRVIVLGGTAAVPESVVTALAARNITVVTRLGGAGRSETSRLIADYLITNMGFTNNTFNVASGAPRGQGADALTGAALSGKQNRALLITDTQTQAAPVVEFARARAGTLNAVGNIFGGTAAVSAALELAIEQAGGTINFNSLTVTPNTPATLTLAPGTNASETGTTPAVNAADNRTYTVNGLDPTGRYRITLVNASSIQTSASGQVTFLSSALENTTGFGVDIGADIADIVSVNGAAPLNNGQPLPAGLRTATGVPTAAGVLTFEIDGESAGTVVPVVYIDAGQGGTATTGGANVRLETTATAAGQFAAASETFGVGGATTFVFPTAAGGTIGGQTGSATVSSVNRTANQFTAANGTFTIDANDTFTVNGVPVTLAEFLAQLSTGDVVSGTFAPNAALSSTFNLNDVNPAAPATATATAGSGAASNDITVSVTFSAPQDVDSIVVERASITGLGGGTVGTFARVGTITPTAAQIGQGGGTATFVDNDVAAGTYRYRAALVNDGDQSPFVTTANVTSMTPSAGDTTAPTFVAATLQTDTGFTGVLDTGDVFTLRVSEALGAIVNGDALRIRDADGTIADVVCGTNATCALNAQANPTTPAGPNAGAVANSVLTVTLTAAPTVLTGGAGTVPGLSIPGTIISTAGLTDVNNNAVSLTTGDVTIG